MLEKRVVYLDEKFVPWNEAKVHIMSHSFARGSAIFEVLSFHEADGGPSARGPAVFRLDEHVKRLMRSAKFLDMQLPLSESQLMETTKETVRRNGLKSGFIKIVCFYPQVALTILPPQKMLTVSVMVVDPAEDFENTSLSSNEAASVCISNWRKLDPQTVPIEAKASANYLNGMVARQEAVIRGFDYAVMLDTQMSKHRQFGAMRVGSFVDGLASASDAGKVVSAATTHLERQGVDLIVSNQSHAAWCSAFSAAGFLRGPSNFLFGGSRKLAELLKSQGVESDQIYLNRGDGDGPINL